MSLSLIIFMLVSGLSLLSLGSHGFIQGARRIGVICQIPPMVIGVVLVGLGTSFPEIMVSLIAALKSNAPIAIGNAIGSNIANMGLVVGLTALVLPLKISPKAIKMHYPIFFGASLIVGVIFFSGQLTPLEGGLLLCLLAAYLYLLFKQTKKYDAGYKFHTKHPPKALMYAIGLWLFGLIITLISADWLVTGAIALAQRFHVSALIIGLTVVAIGTTLPELAATLVSAFQQEHDIAVGNIVGSNIFNLLAVLAMPAIFSPGHIPSHLLMRDFLCMMLMSIILLVIIFLPKRYLIGRVGGGCLLILFIIYIVILSFHII